MNNLSTIEKRGSFKNQIIAFVLLFMLPFCISAQEWDWYTCTHWQWKEYEKYRVFNNRWGTNDQVCMWANSPMSWGVTNTNLPNLSGNVKSFNSIYRGCHYSYCNPNETVLPVRLGDLTSFKGRWAHNKITTGRFLGLWDIYAWTNPQQHGNTIPGKGHWVFMVFQDVYDRTGWFQYPSVSDPLYQGRFYAGDYWWHVRHNPAGGWGSSGPVTIFYADPFSNDLTIDFKALIDLSIEKGWANANWYLGGIETGWEIIEGGNFETTAYWTAINDEPEGPGNCDPDAQITGMVITENEVFLPAGGTEYQLNVEFTPNEACHHLNEITWISDNPDVVSVSPGGVLLPKEKGEATIISYLVANPEIKDSVKITVDISYELKVVNGSGSGRYLEGDSVHITATPPEILYIFDRWSGDIDVLDDPGVKAVSFVMPAREIELTALFNQIILIIGENLIVNGDFTNPIDGTWQLNDNGATVNVGVVNGEAEINISKPGADDWVPQLVQDGFPLIKGQHYEVSFQARASKSMSIVLNVNTGPPGHNVFFRRVVPVTTSMNTFTYTFNANATDINARFDFNLGGTNNQGVVNITGVTLKAIDPQDQTSFEYISGEVARVFPNPFTGGELRISGLSGETHVKIFDLNGKVHYHGKIMPQDVAAINGLNLATGMYLLSLQDNTEVRVLKFNVQ